MKDIITSRISISKWKNPSNFSCDFTATACEKAGFLNKHYSDTYDKLHVLRSNMVAGRAVKLIEEHRNTCKSGKYPNKNHTHNLFNTIFISK